MKILFLDDDGKRTVRAIKHYGTSGFTSAETAKEAISRLDLGKEPFDLVHLDHDLGGKVFQPSDKVSGAEVARFIMTMPEERRPKKIVLHSYNERGVIEMLKILQGHPNVIAEKFHF